MVTHIKIGDVMPRAQYSADGTETNFPYPFPIFQDADLEVYCDSVLMLADYAVTGAGDSAGGNVVFTTPPMPGVMVTLTRKLNISRVSDFQESAAFRSKVLNDELDYQTAALQQLDDAHRRALHIRPYDTTSAEMYLPDLAARAGKVLGFDEDGMPVASTDSLSQIEGAAASAAVAVEAQGVATAQAGIATTKATEASSAAVQAIAAAAEGLYRDVVVVTFADSPYTISSLSDGDFFKVDTSGGEVTLNLPDLFLEANDFRCAVMKETVDGNAVIVQRRGTDTINGATSSTLVAQHEATNFIGDQSMLAWSATDATTGSALLKSLNLSDLTDASAARINLGLNNVGTPIGTVIDYAGVGTPDATWLVCDGSSVSRTAYAALFAAIGTTWGVGDGSTTFTLPDLRRKTTVGAGGTATGTLGNVVGNMGGAESHTLVTGETPVHNHAGATGSAGAHTHAVGAYGTTGGSNSGGVGNGYGLYHTFPTASAGAHAHTVSIGNSGGGLAHNNMQPSAVVQKLIKAA